MRPGFLRASLIPLLAVASLSACTGGTDASTSDDNLSSVPVGDKRNQRETGNCWLFATANWVESLELGARDQMALRPPAPKHVSVAYWDYWDWYAKITGEKVHQGTEKDLRDELDTGGSWGEAVELIAARGLVRAKDFVGDGETREADAIDHALEVVARSLHEGDLRTPSARRDGVRVRRALDRAFDLSDKTIRAMTTSFGEDGHLTLKREGVVATPPVIGPEQLPVRSPRPDGHPVTRPLSDAIGTRVGGQEADVRNGEFAWTRVRFDVKSPEKRREFFQRIQRVLKQGVAVPVAWYWASNGDPDKIQEFRKPPTTPAVEADSTWHETLIFDYEAENVPGFGTLRAGRAATDEQEAAALSPQANITFFRVLDSYYDVKRRERKGFTDMFSEYLLNELTVCPKGDATSRKCETLIPLDEVTLPRGF